MSAPSLDPLLNALHEPMQAVEAVIHDRLSSIAPLIPHISSHLIDAGGKRIRPLLLLAAAKLVNPAAETPAALAAAVEFIHTATLLHDDVVDDGQVRRGKPAANAVWGNKAAVLVGDFLFSRAFQLMVDGGDMEVLRVLADAANTIAEGEVLQLSASGNIKLAEAQYFRIIDAKTAALFAAAMEVGARAAGADVEVSVRFQRIGFSLGRAFQLLDDVLDYSGDAAATGKAIGTDFFEGKVTLPVLKAYAAASPVERTFWENTFAPNAQRDGAALDAALLLLKKHSTLENVRALAAVETEKATALLAPTRATPLGKALDDAVAFLLSRHF
ncbi:MAG: polyprenyl synthetase family protein [Alphaproteobacteria bacterium]|nr:polyprenyl synthetase family protein [Alphaproteobacteria bacterium]